MALSLATAEEVCDDLVQSEVESLFKRASQLFSDEPQSEKKAWKSIFYVAYMLRRFDSSEDLIRIEIQYCRERRDIIYELFLRVCWVFPDFTVHHIWNGEGTRRHQAAWQLSIPAIVVAITELPSVKSGETTPHLASEELINCWESSLIYGIFAMRV